MSRLFLTSEPIKNIVFDFGGVLLDLDFDLTYLKMSELLGTSFYPDQFSDDTLTFLHEFEKGHISKETFLWNLQNLSSGQVPQGKELIDAWNAMLLGWKPEKLDFLQTLRRKYKVYLLSNTNVFHIEWVYKDLIKNHGIYNFNTVFFDKIYYSHEVRMRKPDLNIFSFLVEDAAVNPSESLYIDDLSENVDSALQLGFQGYWHNPSDDLIVSVNKILSQKLR